MREWVGGHSQACVEKKSNKRPVFVCFGSHATFRLVLLRMLENAMGLGLWTASAVPLVLLREEGAELERIDHQRRAVSRIRCFWLVVSARRRRLPHHPLGLCLCLANHTV